MACLRLHVNSNQCKQTTIAFPREDSRFRRELTRNRIDAETECRDTGIQRLMGLSIIYDQFIYQLSLLCYRHSIRTIFKPSL